MPKLPKIRWKTLPAGPRWLVYGVLLLVGMSRLMERIPASRMKL